ncbi:MAG: signal recognition particle-docking protein FtsY [candidate division WOR-3 bacterium]|nr:MAG: signal recognition particle-docking protein FtsY [candidate division WOR-3 bacterium]
MFINKLKTALSKAAVLFARVKAASLDSIEELLLQADVGTTYTSIIMQHIKKTEGDTPEILKREIINLLSLPKPHIESVKPLIIMVSGVNGSGKTTTVAKLAYCYSKEGTVILASGDTYRDAAHEQLEIWACRAGVEVVGSQKGQDAGAVVYDTLSKAMTKNIDTVLIDTAGRLHTRSDLLEELKKMKRVITKRKLTGPDLNILTIDATLGQNSIQQARVFTEAIGINGLILTKCDGTAKGGAVIPICNELKLPILYLGVGENIEDLIEFDPQTFVDALFG